MAVISEAPHFIEQDIVSRELFKSPHRTTEAFHGAPKIASKIAEIRQNPYAEEIYMLPGTGFWVGDEIRLLRENIENGMSFEESSKQIEQDVQGYKIEYLVEMPVFPIVLEKKVVNGRERVVSPLYADKLWVDATSADEREGTVRKSVEELEEKLLNAEPGTIVGMTSPKGWSGYQIKEGIVEVENEEDIKSGRAKPLTYPDSQTYCIEVQQDGSFRGFTLKTNMGVYQNEELLRRLGIDSEKLSKSGDEKERIKSIVSNTFSVGREAGGRIEDIADILMDIKGSGTAYNDTKGNPRTFSEMKSILSNPKNLWTLDNRTQEFIDDFKEYALWGIENKTVGVHDLEIALGFTILRLTNEIRPPQKEAIGEGRMYPTAGSNSAEVYTYEKEKVRMPLVDFDPRVALFEMQQIPGCAGGGAVAAKNATSGMPRVVDSITPRLGVEGGKKILCCTCPFCGKEVEAEISGGRISCPNCKKDAPWSQEGAAGE